MISGCRFIETAENENLSAASDVSENKKMIVMEKGRNVSGMIPDRCRQETSKEGVNFPPFPKCLYPSSTFFLVCSFLKTAATTKYPRGSLGYKRDSVEGKKMVAMKKRTKMPPTHPLNVFFGCRFLEILKRKHFPKVVSVTSETETSSLVDRTMTYMKVILGYRFLDTGKTEKCQEDSKMIAMKEEGSVP